MLINRGVSATGEDAMFKNTKVSLCFYSQSVENTIKTPSFQEENLVDFWF